MRHCNRHYGEICTETITAAQDIEITCDAINIMQMHNAEVQHAMLGQFYAKFTPHL